MAEEGEAAAGPEQVEEEYEVWRKNTPFLYDLVISNPLEWPSLTVQWLPSTPATVGPFVAHKLIFGTHTDGDPNYLLIGDVLLPSDASIAVPDSDSNFPKVEIKQKIRVDRELNRARCMPQNPSLVAVKTSGIEVHVFDCSKHPEQDDLSNPDFRLQGHENEGYGLSWNPFKQGLLVSGSYDKRICLWDVSASPENGVLQPMHVYEAHENLVGDVSWHSKNENLFGSVSDDCRLMIWDMRTNKPQQSVIVHDREVNYLSFNPFNEWILATASSDTTVGLFDLRNLASPLHLLGSHTEEVFQVEWDPNHETVLASSADDRRLMVWDVSRIGEEQMEGEADDGPSELLFSHGGHKDKISDFSWNQNEPWVISSVSEDNTLQVWQLAESLYREDDDYTTA